MTVPGNPSRSRRSARSHQAILQAALALCREHGYASVTIEGIAARAGVGKQTIYRWWPSKAAVVFDAFADVAPGFQAPHTGDLTADVRAFLFKVVKFLNDPDFGPCIAALIGEAQRDPDVRSMFVERFAESRLPRRGSIMARLESAQESGELPPSLDLSVLLEIVFGALYHRLLLGSGPLDKRYARLVVDTVLSGVGNASE